MSPSIIATRPPDWLNAIARLTATVVLPTPPLPAPTAMMFLTPGHRRLARLRRARRAHLRGHLMSTVVTPGIALTAACAWSRIWSFTGQAGVVSSMANATAPPSIRRFLMNLSETMSRLRSGIADGFQRVENGCFGDGHDAYLIRSEVRDRRSSAMSPAIGSLNRSP